MGRTNDLPQSPLYQKLAEDRGDECPLVQDPGIQYLKEVRWKLVKARYASGAENFHELYQYFQAEGDQGLEQVHVEYMIRKLMGLDNSKLPDRVIKLLFEAMDYGGTGRISLAEFLRFTGLASMHNATAMAKTRAAIMKEIEYKDDEEQYLRQKAFEDIEAPWYGPWYPSGTHRLHEWKPPSLFEEETLFLHALITDHIQDAWAQGDLGNQADWFLYCMFELYRHGRNFPEYIRELMCRMLKIVKNELNLKDVFILCSQLDLDHRVSVWQGKSVCFYALTEWLGFPKFWWRPRYRLLAQLHIRTPGAAEQLPGVDSPMERDSVTEIPPTVRDRPASTVEKDEKYIKW